MESMLIIHIFRISQDPRYNLSNHGFGMKYVLYKTMCIYINTE